MDNICHTLVGVAAARAGLATKTSLATATLAIASNLPDIDVLAFTTGIPAVALRRGWTHGVLAQAVLPIAFAGVMWMVARRSRLRHSRPRIPHPAFRIPHPASRISAGSSFFPTSGSSVTCSWTT